MVKLGRKITMSGGGAKLPGFIETKKRWTGNFEYEYRGPVIPQRRRQAGAILLNREIRPRRGGSIGVDKCPKVSSNDWSRPILIWRSGGIVPR
jgi:hypothetical protein